MILWLFLNEEEVLSGSTTHAEVHIRTEVVTVQRRFAWYRRVLVMDGRCLVSGPEASDSS
jgi:cytidylate kinase